MSYQYRIITRSVRLACGHQRTFRPTDFRPYARGFLDSHGGEVGAFHRICDELERYGFDTDCPGMAPVPGQAADFRVEV